jgi:lipid A 3-O-deacylase PagL
MSYNPHCRWPLGINYLGCMGSGCLSSARWAFVLLVIIPCGSPPCLLAQNLSREAAVVSANAPKVPRRSPNEFGLWAGYSPHSFVLEGTSLHRHLFLLNLQYGRILGSRGPFTLKYTADVIPVALESQPTTYYIVHQKVLKNTAGTVFGAGANPFGFQVNFGDKKVQPFANSSIGFLYFTRQVPAPDSSQFNFTFNFGGGIQFFTASRQSFTIGYKYHHLSNADTGIINPGIDSNVIYVGFSLRGWRRAH